MAIFDDLLSLVGSVTTGNPLGIASGVASAIDLLRNPGGRKRDIYKDPYVEKMQRENDIAIERNKLLSPEAARRASASSLQTTLSNATSGALSASTAQNMNAGIGGDANLGANVTGARNIASVMGATAPIQQALAQGHQEAFNQELQKTDEAGKLAAQGAEIGDKYVYDTYNKKPGSGITEALGIGTGLAGYMGPVLNSLGLGIKKVDVDQTDDNTALGSPGKIAGNNIQGGNLADTSGINNPLIPATMQTGMPGSNSNVPNPLIPAGFEEYVDPITGKKGIRRKV